MNLELQLLNLKMAKSLGMIDNKTCLSLSIKAIKKVFALEKAIRSRTQRKMRGSLKYR